MPDRTDLSGGSAGASLLFLREEQLRLAQDLMFFAYRDFTGAADVILEELGLGRAHHRALHYIGRNPGMTVGDLLGILRITKQSLARVLTALVDQGHVAQAPGRDAGGPAVEGFRRVMRGIMDGAGRAYMDRAEAPLHPGARPAARAGGMR